MFYLMFIPFFIMSIYMIFHLRTLQKNDKVLFSLCEIRRKIMSYLRKEGFNLSKEDYYSIRELLKTLNNSIHYYDKAKTILFNYRRFIDFLKEYDNDITLSKKLKTDNQVIINFQKEFIYSYLLGFFTYTPFIKSEIVFSIVIYFFEAIAKITKKQVQYYINILYQIKKQSEDSGIPLKLLQPVKSM